MYRANGQSDMRVLVNRLANDKGMKTSLHANDSKGTPTMSDLTDLLDALAKVPLRCFVPGVLCQVVPGGYNAE